MGLIGQRYRVGYDPTTHAPTIFDAVRNRTISQEQYQSDLANYHIPGAGNIGPSAPAAPSAPSAPAAGVAGNQPAQQPNAPAGGVTPAPAASTAAPAPSGGVAPSAAPATQTGSFAIGPSTKELQDAALNNGALWQNQPLMRNAPALIQQANSLNDAALYYDSIQDTQRASQARQQAQYFNDTASKLLDNAVSNQAEALKTINTKNIEQQQGSRVSASGAKYTLPFGAAQNPVTPPVSSDQQNAGPTEATINKTNGQVVTAIPPAPAGGGMPQVQLPSGAIQTELSPAQTQQTELDKKIADTYLTNGQVIDTGIKQVMAMNNALKSTESGKIENAAQIYAQWADSMGYHDLAKKIASGEVSAAQVLGKNNIGATLSTLAAANSRFTQGEFKKTSELGMPDMSMTPAANFQLNTEMLGSLMRQKAFQNDWNKAQQQGWSSVGSFYNSWSQANPQEKFDESAARQLGNVRGMDLPPRTEWTVGTTYVLPPNVNPQLRAAYGQLGIKPGDVFKYNGENQKPTIIPPSKAYQGAGG
jgi:hypothetical protein